MKIIPFILCVLSVTIFIVFIIAAISYPIYLDSVNIKNCNDAAARGDSVNFTDSIYQYYSCPNNYGQSQCIILNGKTYCEAK